MSTYAEHVFETKRQEAIKEGEQQGEIRAIRQLLVEQLNDPELTARIEKLTSFADLKKLAGLLMSGDREEFQKTLKELTLH